MPAAPDMDFQAWQRAFTQHIRAPREARRPSGVPARRMRVYNNLLFNNMDGFLLSCFPVCRKLLGKRKWTRLVRAYFRDHACHTPYFRQIPEEFLRYLQDEWDRPAAYPEFLPELAHYEWVELALATSNLDEHLPAHDPHGDLIAGRPVLNPVMRILAYRYPVHRLSPRNKPSQPPDQPTFLLAFRDAELAVHFMQTSPATARLLSLFQENPAYCGWDALARLAEEMGRTLDELHATGAGMLDELRSQGVLLGVHAT